MEDELREKIRFLEQKLMHEHFFVALTLERLLENPAKSAQVCIKCIQYAAKVDRPSALKAIQMIAKRQANLRLLSREI